MPWIVIDSSSRAANVGLAAPNPGLEQMLEEIAKRLPKRILIGFG